MNSLEFFKHFLHLLLSEHRAIKTHKAIADVAMSLIDPGRNFMQINPNIYIGPINVIV